MMVVSLSPAIVLAPLFIVAALLSTNCCAVELTASQGTLPCDSIAHNDTTVIVIPITVSYLQLTNCTHNNATITFATESRRSARFTPGPPLVIEYSDSVLQEGAVTVVGATGPMVTDLLLHLENTRMNDVTHGGTVFAGLLASHVTVRASGTTFITTDATALSVVSEMAQVVSIELFDSVHSHALTPSTGAEHNETLSAVVRANTVRDVVINVTGNVAGSAVRDVVDNTTGIATVAAAASVVPLGGIRIEGENVLIVLVTPLMWRALVPSTNLHFAESITAVAGVAAVGGEGRDAIISITGLRIVWSGTNFAVECLLGQASAAVGVAAASLNGSVSIHVPSVVLDLQHLPDTAMEMATFTTTGQSAAALGGIAAASQASNVTVNATGSLFRATSTVGYSMTMGMDVPISGGTNAIGGIAAFAGNRLRIDADASRFFLNVTSNTMLLPGTPFGGFKSGGYGVAAMFGVGGYTHGFQPTCVVNMNDANLLRDGPLTGFTSLTAPAVAISLFAVTCVSKGQLRASGFVSADDVSMSSRVEVGFFTAMLGALGVNGSALALFGAQLRVWSAAGDAHGLIQARNMTVIEDCSSASVSFSTPQHSAHVDKLAEGVSCSATVEGGVDGDADCLVRMDGFRFLRRSFFDFSINAGPGMHNLLVVTVGGGCAAIANSASGKSLCSVEAREVTLEINGTSTMTSGNSATDKGDVLAAALGLASVSHAHGTASLTVEAPNLHIDNNNGHYLSLFVYGSISASTIGGIAALAVSEANISTVEINAPDFNVQQQNQKQNYNAGVSIFDDETVALKCAAASGIAALTLSRFGNSTVTIHAPDFYARHAVFSHTVTVHTESSSAILGLSALALTEDGKSSVDISAPRLQAQATDEGTVKNPGGAASSVQFTESGSASASAGVGILARAHRNGTGTTSVNLDAPNATMEVMGELGRLWFKGKSGPQGTIFAGIVAESSSGPSSIISDADGYRIQWCAIFSDLSKPHAWPLLRNDTNFTLNTTIPAASGNHSWADSGPCPPRLIASIPPPHWEYIQVDDPSAAANEWHAANSSMLPLAASLAMTASPSATRSSSRSEPGSPTATFSRSRAPTRSASSTASVSKTSVSVSTSPTLTSTSSLWGRTESLTGKTQSTTGGTQSSTGSGSPSFLPTASDSLSASCRQPELQVSPRYVRSVDLRDQLRVALNISLVDRQPSQMLVQHGISFETFLTISSGQDWLLPDLVPGSVRVSPSGESLSLEVGVPPGSVKIFVVATIRVSVTNEAFTCAPGLEDISVVVNVDPSTKPISPKVVKVIEAVSVTATAVSSAMSSPTVAVQRNRVNAVASLSQCKFSHNEPVEGSPFDWRVGDATGAYYRGALVGNFVIFLFVVVMSALATWLLYNPSQSVRRTVVESMQLLHLPGLWVVPIALLCQGTVSVATSLYNHGTHPIDKHLCWTTATIVIAFWAAVMYLVTIGFKCEATVRPGDHLTDIVAKPLWVRCLARWLFSPIKWRDRPTSDGKSFGFKQHWHPLFIDFREGYQWYFGFEMSLAIVVGILEGIKDTSCDVVLWMFVALIVLHTPTAIFVRPFAAAYNTFFHIVLSVGTCLAVALGVAASQFMDYESAEQERTLAAAAWCALIVEVLSGIKLGFDILMLLQWFHTWYVHHQQRIVNKKRASQLEDANVRPDANESLVEFLFDRWASCWLGGRRRRFAEAVEEFDEELEATLLDSSRDDHAQQSPVQVDREDDSTCAEALI